MWDSAARRGTRERTGAMKSLKGRVDNEGNVHSGTNWFNEEKIGRIDDGDLLRNQLDERRKGRTNR